MADARKVIIFSMRTRQSKTEKQSIKSHNMHRLNSGGSRKSTSSLRRVMFTHAWLSQWSFQDGGYFQKILLPSLSAFSSCCILGTIYMFSINVQEGFIDRIA